MSICQQFQLGKTEYQMTSMVIWNKLSIIWILDTVYIKTVFIIYLKLSFNWYPVFLFAKSSKITVDSDCSHEIKRPLLLGRKAMTNLDSILQSRDITLPTVVCLVKAMVFPVVTYGCESWTIKKAECWKVDFWTVVLEKTLESPLDCKEIQSVHPKGNQSWIFTRRTDAEAEAAVLATWWEELTHWRKIGKDWRQKEKEAAEDEMFR